MEEINRQLTEQITFRSNPIVRKQLQSIARKQRLKESDVVRIALKKYAKNFSNKHTTLKIKTI